MAIEGRWRFSDPATGVSEKTCGRLDAREPGGTVLLQRCFALRRRRARHATVRAQTQGAAHPIGAAAHGPAPHARRAAPRAGDSRRDRRATVGARRRRRRGSGSQHRHQEDPPGAERLARQAEARRAHRDSVGQGRPLRRRGRGGVGRDRASHAGGFAVRKSDGRRRARLPGGWLDGGRDRCAQPDRLSAPARHRSHLRDGLQGQLEVARTHRR